MKLYILGAEGQMGCALAQATAERGLDAKLYGREDCNVRSEQSVRAALVDAHAGDIVFNAAARLGTQQAETDPLPQLKTNVRGALMAARIARDLGAAIVHFSTDYVFDGSKNGPYVESDRPNPINMYGALKLASELLVRRANPAHYVVRVASVFGRAKHSSKGLNFVEKMLDLARTQSTVAVDEVLVMSPTYALDAANATLDLITKDASYNTYHAANSGSCSWYEFTQAIFELSGIKCQVVPREGSGDSVQRPANSSLATQKLSGLGIHMRPWRDALAAYLQSI